MRRFFLLAAILFSAASAAAPQDGSSRAPTDDQVDDTVTLDALVAPGDDSMRWTGPSGAEIEGFVIDVHAVLPVGTCPAPRAGAETILELTTDPNILDASHRFFAIVTTAWRQKTAAAGKNWSTAMLQARLLRRSVRIRGWLVFAQSQASCSVNTADVGSPTSRATAWEIRPVTSIVLSDPDAGPAP